VVLTTQAATTPVLPGVNILHWDALLSAPARPGHRIIDTDLLSILYTSGSTGRPKGVVLSHRNMVAGAKSVASYLGNTPDDTLLAALPLSFDAGFSQLTTAFHSGAKVVLLNYLLPHRPDRGATSVYPARPAEVACRSHRPSALLCEYRRAHAA
jgi:acyl-CoA synthetase (AMP-forming)/AMP-acid ligase II